MNRMLLVLDAMRFQGKKNIRSNLFRFVLLLFLTHLFGDCRKWISDLVPRFTRFSYGKSILHLTLLCVNFLHIIFIQKSSLQSTVYACFPELLPAMKKRNQRDQRILIESLRI